MTQSYADAWETFWGNLSGTPGEVLWDVDPAEAVALDMQRFAPLFRQKRPIIDLGCGSGIQTHFLAQHFPQVIGVDVAPSVIAQASRTQSAPNLTYEVLDVLSRDQVDALHARLGDANVYMRGVLMQFRPDDRPRAVANIQRLMGQAGVLYLNEYPHHTKTYYQQLFQAQGMAPAFARVLQAGITPGGLTTAELAALFPPAEFEVLLQGEHQMHTSIPLAEGGYAAAPALYLAVRPK